LDQCGDDRKGPGAAGTGTDFFEQTLDTELTDPREILPDRGKRRQEIARLGDVIEPDNRDIIRDRDTGFMKSANCSQRHLVVGHDQSGEFTPVILYQSLGCLKSA
jgi:hypothetical protein